LAKSDEAHAGQRQCILYTWSLATFAKHELKSDWKLTEELSTSKFKVDWCQRYLYSRVNP